MKIHCIALFLLFLAACNEEVKHVEESQVEATLDYPYHFDGAWVMLEEWMGYMGVALALSGDRYYYWMYSDVPVDASYPYTGKYRVEGDNLVLSSPTVLATGESADEMPEWGLYSRNWRILQDGLSVRLHSTSDAPEDHARALYPDFGFDPTTPFKNQAYMKKTNKSEIAVPRKPSD